MSQLLRFPTLDGCKVSAGPPLAAGERHVLHTTAPAAAVADLPKKSKLMKKAELPFQKVRDARSKKEEAQASLLFFSVSILFVRCGCGILVGVDGGGAVRELHVAADIVGGAGLDIVQQRRHGARAVGVLLHALYGGIGLAGLHVDLGLEERVKLAVLYRRVEHRHYLAAAVHHHFQLLQLRFLHLHIIVLLLLHLLLLVFHLLE